MGEVIEMKKRELTDEEIETVIDVLAESQTEDTKVLRNLKSNQGIETNPIPIDERPVPIEVESNIVIDNRNGEFRLTDNTEVDNDADVKISDIADDKSFGLSDIEITGDMIKEKINSVGDELSDEETQEFLNVIMRFKKGEKFSVYNSLPPSFKKAVNQIAIQYGDIGGKNSIAKMVLEQFISELQIDKAFIEFNDAIKKELQLPNLTEMYSEHRQEVMEVKLLESADKIQELDPKKAELLRNVSVTFTDTYKMETLKKAVGNRKNRQFIKDTNKFNKICRDFNIKYENSRFKINNVSLLLGILDRKLPKEYDIDSIMKFIMLFCRECHLRDSNDILDHTFMYYTIQNILMLDYIDENNESNDFGKQLLNNIIEVIDLIKQYNC